MRTSSPIIGIILAAGGSTRMGRQKALLSLENTTVVSCHVDALSVVCTEILVVIGANASGMKQALACHNDTVKIIENPKWRSTDQIDSLRLALTTIPKGRAVIVTPVDTPPASPQTLSALRHSLPDTTVPLSSKNERGHPVLLSSKTVAQILTTEKTDGLRSYLATAGTVQVSDELLHLDFDTPNQWREFVSRWTNRS